MQIAHKAIAARIAAMINHPIAVGWTLHSTPTFVMVVIVMLPSAFVTTVSYPMGMVTVLVMGAKIFRGLRLHFTLFVIRLSRGANDKKVVQWFVTQGSSCRATAGLDDGTPLGF
jgi:hypothetical protein